MTTTTSLRRAGAPAVYGLFRANVIAIVFTTVLLLGGCGGGKGAADSASAGESTASQAGAAASQSAPSALIDTTPVVATTVRQMVTAYGNVDYSPGGAQVLGVQSEAVVARLLVSPGQAVVRGEALLVLAPSATAKLDLDKATIDLRFARQEADRLIELRSRELATNAEVQAAQKNVASLQAVLANLTRRDAGGATRTLRAHAAGVVQAVSVQPGQLVAPGAPLLTLGDAARLRVRLGVAQDELVHLHAGQVVLVRPLDGNTAPIATRIAQIFSQIDPRTRLAEAVVALPAGHGLLNGVFVRGEIVVAEHADAMVVPHSAVLYTGDKPHVFVDLNGHAALRPVETGIEVGDRVEIVRGLAPGDAVVSTGNAQLKDGMPLRRDLAK